MLSLCSMSRTTTTLGVLPRGPGRAWTSTAVTSGNTYTPSAYAKAPPQNLDVELNTKLSTVFPSQTNNAQLLHASFTAHKNLYVL